MRRFFCENCGEEVSEKEDVCHHCGAFFVAIKCPRCRYRGKKHEFFRGCPKCGYLAERTGFETAFRRVRNEGRAARARRPMPAWVFWAALATLLLSFVLLSRVYVRLG